MEIIPAKRENLKKIITALSKKKVLVFPTDTVYGLLCDSTDKKAVEKIFKIKKRSRTKPLAVFVKDIVAAKKVAHISKEQERFLKKYWPGATTVILKARKGLSKLIYRKNKIGLRVPDYEFVNLVLNRFKAPLAQTSANISGQPPTTKIKDVLSQFERANIQPDLIVDAGDLPQNKPSKIIDLTNNKFKIIRR